MAKIKTVELTQSQRTALEKGYRQRSSHAFRMRCQMILLKSEQRTSAQIASILGCCEMVVNNRIKRFTAEGVEGLRTKAPKQVAVASLYWMLICKKSKQRSKPIANASAWPKRNWKQNLANPSPPKRLSGI
ncbi:MAG TPA: helix-turn-helix domain-containing protein [Blastocatellia bacterium]|jgi:hypothetical protein